jgi:5'-3' exonuclease
MKKSSNFDENWTHCFFSPDADMIILGLLTKIKNVVILRE